MREIKRLLFQVLDIVAMLENRKNQPHINRIRGLILEILDELEV